MKYKYERKDWLAIILLLVLAFILLPGFVNMAKAGGIQKEPAKMLFQAWCRERPPQH